MLPDRVPRTIPERAGTGSAAGILAWSLALAVAVYAALLLSGERLLNDPDTYWHIAAGRWIWAHHAVPRVDPFSATLAGAPWHAHEWLAELIFAGAYEALGWAGVVIVSAVAGAAALALLMAALMRVLAPKRALLAVALSFFLLAAHLVARPHLLALPLLVFWTAALLAARAQARAPALALLPLMALWANLHGGFVVGLALAGIFAVEAQLAAPDRRQRIESARGWGGFLAGALAASLLTPHGFEAWLFPFRLLGLSFSLGFVGEWHSPDFSHFQPIELWLLALLALALALRPRLAPLRLLLLLALIHMALAHARNSELLALIAPLILAEPVAVRLGRDPSLTSSSRAPRAIAACAALLMLALSVIVGARGFPNHHPKLAPVAALAAAEQAHLGGVVLNDYDFGGYLIFAGIPPFVDGRVDLYGDAFMRDYAAALGAKGDALPRLLARYRVRWTLLAPQTPAVAALDREPGWARLYADGDAVIHRRIAGE